MADLITLTEETVTISELVLTNKDSISFLKQIPEQELAMTVAKAVEIGLFCLERGRNTQDLEYVKRQVQELLQKVETAVSAVPGSTERALLAKLGTENGQVLYPVKSLIEASAAAASVRLEEVKTLLTNDLDPKSGTSTLGLALTKIATLLDPSYADSVQSAIAKAISSVADEDGEMIKTVTRCVKDSIGPLKEEIDGLSRTISGEKMVADALANTTLKGPDFEDLIAVRLAEWAKGSGGHCQRVGEDNQPGDFIVDFFDDASGTKSLRVVIEARDRNNAVGRQKITQDLIPKFRKRDAQAAIYVSKSLDGLAKEIGEFAEGHCECGPWVACTYDHLTLALRFVAVEHRIRKLRESRPDVDTSVISCQVQAVSTSLGRIRTIKSKVTDLTKTAEAICGEADLLKTEVSLAISAIEEELRKKRKEPSSVNAIQFQAKTEVEQIAI